MRNVVLLAVLVFLTVGVRAERSQTPPPQNPPSVSYDTFWQADVQGRLRMFNEISPENRAALVRTHIERWLDQNRSRLSAEQVKAMEDNRDFVTPEMYSPSRPPEVMERAKVLQQRTAALFSQEEIMQALTIQADYIPAKTKK